MQGSSIESSIDLKQYVDLTSKDINDVFWQLWGIIGKDGEAPFYVDGSTYFNKISPYINGLPPTYSKYIELLPKGKTSRINWYKSLFEKIEISEIPYFLDELSAAINKYYNENDTNNIDVKTEEGNKSFLQPAAGDITTRSNIATIPVDTGKKKKTIFISYCHEDVAHNEWVKKLYKDLDPSFKVNIDQNLPLGGDINRFMESNISDADKVLIIATPEYKKRADDRENGVGYETSIITNDLITLQNKIKFIPIIRKGSFELSCPKYLQGKKGLSMCDKDNYDTGLRELIESINDN